MKSGRLERYFWITVTSWTSEISGFANNIPVMKNSNSASEGSDRGDRRNN
jgi:hypothetical protein